MTSAALPNRYTAFISYKHPLDENGRLRIRRFESALKRYAKPLLRPPIRVFRDEISLVPSANLPELIKAALSASDYFVLLASPQAAVSPWVEDELRIWFEVLKRGESSLLIVLIEGSIKTNSIREIDWVRSDALPRILARHLTAIPLWVDLTKLDRAEQYDLANPSFKTAVNAIVARFQNIEPEAMLGVELAHHRRTIRRAWAVGISLLTLTAIAATFGVVAENRRSEAVRLQALAVARQLAAQATLEGPQQPHALDRHALLAVESLRRSPTLEGWQTLNSALSLMRRTVYKVSHHEPILNLMFSPDGRMLATVSAGSERGMLNVVEAATGKVFYSKPFVHGLTTAIFSQDSRLLAVSGWGKDVAVYDATTGKDLFHLTHPESVSSLTLSPDGRWIATGSANAVHLWTNTGKLVSRFTHDGQIEALSFSKDSQLLASASSDGRVRLRRMADGANVAVLRHTAAIEAVAVSPDGRRVAIGGVDNTVRMWDVSTGRSVFQRSHDDAVTHLAFSPDGTWLASASGDAFRATGQVWVWLVGTDEGIGPLTHQGPVTSLQFHPDEWLLATASVDNTSRLWELSGGREVARLTHEKPVSSVAFSPAGDLVATGAHDLTAKVWKLQGSGVVRMLHGAPVNKLAISPDGRVLATGIGFQATSMHGLVHLRDAQSGQKLRTLRFDRSVDSLSISHDGKLVAAASTEHTQARVWSIVDGKEVARLSHQGGVNELVFHPTRWWVGTASRDGWAILWDATNGERVAQIKHGKEVESLTFDFDGARLATVSNDTMVIWHIDEAREVIRLSHDGRIRDVVFDPSGCWLTAVGSDGTLRTYDTKTWREHARLKHGASASGGRYSPNGRLLASFGGDNLVRLWDNVTGKELAVLAHDAPVESLAFSMDSQWVLTGGWDNTARVWEAASGREVARVVGEHVITDVAFGADGKRMFSASWGRVVDASLWEPSRMIAAACEHLGRDLTTDEWIRYLPGQPPRRTCEGFMTR